MSKATTPTTTERSRNPPNDFDVVLGIVIFDMAEPFHVAIIMHPEATFTLPIPRK